MGGAFVAVADDASAIYWNPAGLAGGAFVSAVVDYGRLENGDADEPALSEPRARRTGTLVAFGIPPLGLGYYRLSVDAAAAGSPAASVAPGGAVAVRDVTTLVTDHFAVTLLHSLADGIHVGAALKIVRGEVSAGAAAMLPGSTVADTWDASADQADSQTKGDVDAGLLIDRGTWRLGLLARNLTAPTFTARGGRQVGLDRQARAGFALLPRDRLTLALDADVTVTSGADGRRRAIAAGGSTGRRPRGGSASGSAHARTRSTTAARRRRPACQWPSGTSPTSMSTPPSAGTCLTVASRCRGASVYGLDSGNRAGPQATGDWPVACSLSPAAAGRMSCLLSFPAETTVFVTRLMPASDPVDLAVGRYPPRGTPLAHGARVARTVRVETRSPNRGPGSGWPFASASFCSKRRRSVPRSSRKR